jgi:hypothetical protein
MKITSLPIQALLAVIAAAALLPVGPAAASIAFTLAGMLAVLFSDYGREIEPVRAQASVIPFHFEAGNRGNLDRAA